MQADTSRANKSGHLDLLTTVIFSVCQPWESEIWFLQSESNRICRAGERVPEPRH